MPSEPVWLEANQVIAINADQVEQTGENHQTLFDNKLEGALMRPKNLFVYENQDDVIALAAMTMVSIGQAHAFEQGNKRTAFVSGLMLLYLNGYALLDNIDSEYLADRLTAAIIGDDHDFEDLCDLLESFVEPL